MHDFGANNVHDIIPINIVYFHGFFGFCQLNLGRINFYQLQYSMQKIFQIDDSLSFTMDFWQDFVYFNEYFIEIG